MNFIRFSMSTIVLIVNEDDFTFLDPVFISLYLFFLPLYWLGPLVMWDVCVLSHVWLRDPMDLQGSSVHGIFQVRILEWISISFSNSWRKLTFTFTLRASLVAQIVKNLPALWETQVRSLGREDPLEEGMGTQSSILAWRIPWTEDPGGLQAMG